MQWNNRNAHAFAGRGNAHVPRMRRWDSRKKHFSLAKRKKHNQEVTSMPFSLSRCSSEPQLLGNISLDHTPSKLLLGSGRPLEVLHVQVLVKRASMLSKLCEC